MTVPPRYRAVICGEEVIVYGWQGQELVTNKGRFFIRHIYSDLQIQNWRIFEIALIQSDGNGNWLINGKELSYLKSLRNGLRFGRVPMDENLRVYKDQICAVAWLQANDKGEVTQLLDMILEFWKTASKDVQGKATSTEERLQEHLEKLAHIYTHMQVFEGWSRPIWLTEFRPANQAPIISPEQKQIAQVTTELEQTKAQLRRAEAVAGDTLEEALSKWMRFDPPGMKADTKARIEKAVKLYVTDPDKRSLAKVASEFEVSRKTVSGWFEAFRKETGFNVVAHRRHESVRDHLQTDSEPEEEG